MTVAQLLINLHIPVVSCIGQGCSGAGARRTAVPANIFEPERRSGKYYLRQAER